MALLARDNWHSTLVAWAKVVLPLIALALLSTLFLLSRHSAPEDLIPYADSRVEDRLRQPQLTAPTFATMTKDGAAVTLKAQAAVPGTPGSAEAGQATDLTGHVETPDGTQTDLAAPQAVLDQKASQVVLSGGVLLTNSLGYRMETPGLSVALDRTRLESAGPVVATAPMGRIEAGRMVLTRAPDGHYTLDFLGGVHLLYQPKAPG